MECLQLRPIMLKIRRTGESNWRKKEEKHILFWAEKKVWVKVMVRINSTSSKD